MKKYPASLTIDYSKKSNRKTVLFRIFLAIPVFIILILLTSPNDMNHHHKECISQLEQGGALENLDADLKKYIGDLHESDYDDGGNLLFLAILLMILFRQKYPKWWFNWNLELNRFAMRVCAYLLFLRDEYPSTDEENNVHLNLIYPNVKKDLNRWMPLVKWFLAIPHYIVIVFLLIGVVICSIYAWFAVLFTGRYPKNVFDYVVGTLRWSLRVSAYMLLLITDEYPPFSLKEL